ncbi:MAG TPA: protein translocase subunit SecD [Blastocatellia bacterium]|nr:protein translocase subunit SecD [Blastocatellia bacterium]
MGKKIRNRMLIILVVTLAGLAMIFKPHHKLTAQDISSWSQIKQNLGENIHLGLDLKGGSHLVMQVQVDDVIQKKTQQNVEAAKTKLQQKNLPFTEIKAQGINQVVITVPDAARNGDIVNEIQNDFGRDWTISDRGNTITATLDEGAANQLRDRATDQAKEIIENRVNAFGVTEPIVARQGGEGTYQILIQMPGIDDTERVKNTLNADSNLELRLEAKNTSVYPAKDAAEAAIKSLPNSDQYEVFPYRERTAEGTSGQEQWLIIEKNMVVGGLDMRDASARQSATGSSNYEIAFSLTPTAATRFAEVTGKNIGEFLCIVLNNEVKSRATIQGQIHDQGQITGSFTKRQAEDLALILRSGALPAKAVYLEERTVGPSLGADSIRQGVTASVAGLLAVIAFMLFYYRGSGINAVLALILNLILLLAALVMFGATLTLPGIAGVILTIGMAVDSNVLIFERIREELRNGKVVASAVDVGFGKAFLTIIDTHVTTIVSAIFLFVFGTGPIRGFAVTLVAGLLANLFTAIFVSRTIFMWHLNRRARVESLSI